MNRKILILSVVILTVISVSGLYLGKTLKKKQNSLVLSQLPAPTPSPVELTTWKDQSEFEFKYPKSLTLNPHEEDNENYAHVELTSSAFPGSLILWTKDTKYASVDDYIKGEKITSYIGSTLGQIPAVKVMNPADNNKLNLLAIRNGYLYEIELNSQSQPNWTDIFNTVVDSYTFPETTSMEKPASEKSVPAPADTYFNEEVIE